MQFVHGPDMDFDISNIDLRNLKYVDVIIRNWEKDNHKSLDAIRERGWYNFLNKDYDSVLLLMR